MAHSGLDGLLTARKENSGLILNVVDLPVITGIEMMRAIRNFSYNIHTPVRFGTSFALEPGFDGSSNAITGYTTVLDMPRLENDLINILIRLKRTNRNGSDFFLQKYWLVKFVLKMHTILSLRTTVKTQTKWYTTQSNSSLALKNSNHIAAQNLRWNEKAHFTH
ncbi:MAG TPA: hypothetical protein VIS49_10475 [Cyclobacteriaceae bacterium]